MEAAATAAPMDGDACMSASEETVDPSQPRMDTAPAPAGTQAGAGPGTWTGSALRSAASAGRGHPVCQVPGCGRDLSGSRGYHQRYKICEEHFRVRSIELNGKTVRFCQQCGKFQPLEDFNEDRRSCSVQLALHAGRRRKRHALARARKLSDALKQRFCASDGSGSEDEGTGGMEGSSSHHAMVGLSEQEVRVLRGIIRSQNQAGGIASAPLTQPRPRDLPPPHPGPATGHVAPGYPAFDPPSKSHLVGSFGTAAPYPGMGLPPGYQPAHQAPPLTLSGPPTLVTLNAPPGAVAALTATGEVVPNSSDSVQTMTSQVVSRLQALAAGGATDISSYGSLLPPSTSSAPNSQQTAGWGSAPMAEDRPAPPHVVPRTSMGGGAPGRMVIASTGQLMAHLTQVGAQDRPMPLGVATAPSSLASVLASGMHPGYPGGAAPHQPQLLLPHHHLGVGAAGGMAQPPPRSALLNLTAAGGRMDLEPPSMGSLRHALPASAPQLTSPRAGMHHAAPSSSTSLHALARGDPRHPGLVAPPMGLEHHGAAPPTAPQAMPQLVYVQQMPGYGTAPSPALTPAPSAPTSLSQLSAAHLPPQQPQPPQPTLIQVQPTAGTPPAPGREGGAHGAGGYTVACYITAEQLQQLLRQQQPPGTAQ